MFHIVILLLRSIGCKVFLCPNGGILALRLVRSMGFQVRNLSDDRDWRFATCPNFGILALRRVRFHGYSLMTLSEHIANFSC